MYTKLLLQNKITDTQKAIRKSVRGQRGGFRIVKRIPEFCIEYIFTKSEEKRCSGEIINQRCTACGVKYIGTN